SAPVVALAGDHAAVGQAEDRAWQPSGGAPLVRGADDLLAAFLRAPATTLGPLDRNPRGVPATGLSPDLPTHVEPIASLFPIALRTTSTDRTAPAVASTGPR